MFDIAFSELAVIGVVALVVIGPKRLPLVARVAGRLFGQFNRYVAQVKTEVNKEMERAELADIRKEFEAGAQSFKSGVSQLGNIKADIGQDLAKIENDMRHEVAQIQHPATPPATLNHEAKPTPNTPPAA